MTADADTQTPGHASAGVPEWATRIVLALVPVLLALIAGALILLLLGRDPLSFYANIVRRGLLSWIGLQETITRCAPLILLGASLIVAFRAGLWNLGIDGQFLLAAVITAPSTP